MLYLEGAGGFVVNDKNQLLVVQERFSPKPHWKLPGGHADPGTYISIKYSGLGFEIKYIVYCDQDHLITCYLKLCN